MNILIIGSKGFIGSHVYQYYKNAEAWQAWGCDVVSDYVDSNYFLVDATNADYDSIFRAQSFQACINCSGAASVPDSLINPLRDYYLNTKNLVNILDAIRKHQPQCKLLNLSSAAVYGNPPSLPITEASAIKPLSPYGWHKYYSELACKEYHHIFGLRTCSARIFSAYGQGLRKQLFWDWFKKASKSNRITIWGTGSESRDFIFIEDLVQALNCIVQRAQFDGEAINVANGQEIFIHEAIEVFKMQSGLNFEYAFNNEVRMGDPVNWCADVSLLKTLGYISRFTMAEGLMHYFKWLQQMAR